MSEENLDWIFVRGVPMLCDKSRIAKQQKVETWLNLYQLVAQLSAPMNANGEAQQPVKYVI